MQSSYNYYDALDWLKNNGYTRYGGYKDFEPNTLVDFIELYQNEKTKDEIILKVFIDRKISFYKRQKNIKK